MPTSISGKHHHGETQGEHINAVVALIKHLCNEFRITGSRRDVLITAGLLHDIGLVLITVKEDIEKYGSFQRLGWKYFKDTGYSRQYEAHQLHPMFSAQLIKKYGQTSWPWIDEDNLDRMEDIIRLVSCHMSHWYAPVCPQPKTLDERILCIADYLASKGTASFRYED